MEDYYKRKYFLWYLLVILIIIFLLSPISSYANGGWKKIVTEWKVIYGNPVDSLHIIDIDANYIIQTSDGGYAIVGEVISYGGLVWDPFIMKLDAQGNKTWMEIYSSSMWPLFSSREGDYIIQTFDEGYAIVGRGHSSEDSDWYHWDVILIKTDKHGNKQWEKVFENRRSDLYMGGKRLLQTSDGGYVILATNYGLIKISRGARIEWEKRISVESLNSFVKSDGDGYVIVGKKSPSLFGWGDVFVIKIDENGNKVWNVTFGGEGFDEGQDIIQTSDGGYAIVGTTTLYGSEDIWLINIDKNGNKRWDKIFEKRGSQEGRAIIQTFDGGYAIVGRTRSSEDSDWDVIVIKTDKYGNKEWEKVFGGEGFDDSNSIIQVSENKYVIGGTRENTQSGEENIFVIKFYVTDASPIPDFNFILLFLAMMITSFIISLRKK